MPNLFIFSLIMILFAYPSFSLVPDKQSSDLKINREPYFKGRLLAKIDPQYATLPIFKLEASLGIKGIHTYSIVPGLKLYEFDPSLDVMEVIRKVLASDAVIYAEPDYIYHAAITKKAIPNDSEFKRQWALENTGQNNGKADADINAELMWSYQKGSKDVVIGIIDTGLDYNHQDLKDNVWNNPAEIPGNNEDDDLNGYVDDIHGINAIKGNGNPMDDNVHGTHVAGIIGAIGNNSVGVVGVAQEVKIAACKFLSSRGSGSISDAIQCMDYFALLKSNAQNPVNIVATNNSWGGGNRSQAMLDAIIAHERLGILFVAAAGNDSSNNDITDSFPANYDVPNVISVAATDSSDRLAVFSSYGKRTVHVGSPGVKIISTTLNQKYGEFSGTSMAAPHVTGLSAIIASQYPNLSYFGIKNLIMTGGQSIDATKNTTVSGRRIRGADVDGVGSLTCENQVLVARNQPTASTYRIPSGKPFLLSALHINCANPAGPLTVYEGQDGDLVLNDNGDNGDNIANDGIYSLLWTPITAGTYELRFADSDIVVITVFLDTNDGTCQANHQAPFDYLPVAGKPPVIQSNQQSALLYSLDEADILSNTSILFTLL